jgi:hypothetical protein
MATERERIQQTARKAGGWHLVDGLGDERYARRDGTFIDVFYNQGCVRTANITAPSGRFTISRRGEDVLAWVRPTNRPVISEVAAGRHSTKRR